MVLLFTLLFFFLIYHPVSLFTHFWPVLSFYTPEFILYPLKTSENLWFSGVIKCEHWPEICVISIVIQ